METIQKTSIYIIALVILFFFTNCSKEANADDPPSTNFSDIVFTKSNQTLGNTRTTGLAIADIDFDDDQDVFIANLIGPSKLWLNNGNGTFTQSNQNFDASVHDVGMANLNGDTYPDIFLLIHDSPSKIFFNEGDGTFTQSTQNIGSSSDYPQYLDFGDVDNDGDIDAFIYNWLEVPNRLWLNDGTGFFTMVEIDYGGSEAMGFELADFDDDSFLDLFLLMRDLPNQIWLNNAAGEFINNGYSFGMSGEDSDCKDYDSDGDFDIAIGGINGVAVWLNQDNTGTFIPQDMVVGSTLRIKLIDADFDGDYDLITTDFQNGNKLWENDGAGSFESLGQIFVNSEVLSIGCQDLDGDKDYDIVFGQLEGTGGNSIYFNESIISGINENQYTICQLHRNYPNPFKLNTTIEFSLNESAQVILKIYNSQGRNIRTLVDDYMPAGTYKIAWNVKDDFDQDLSSGTYYYEITCDGYFGTMKMMLIE